MNLAAPHKGARAAWRRLRRRAAALVEQGRNTLDGARRRSRAVDVAVLTYERDRRAVGSVLAGAVAFRLFVYLLPLFLAVLTLAGVLAGISRDSPRELGEHLGMSAYVVDSVETGVEQSRRSVWVLVPLALWAVYTAGLGAAKVVWAVHALAWNQPVGRRRQGPATATVTFLVAAATFGLVAVMQAVRDSSPGLGLGSALLGAVPFVALWWLVSRLLPHDPRAPWTALVPGALLVGGFLWITHLTSAYWIAYKVQHASELYGSLGVAAGILAFLYLSGRLLVASAMLNATLWEHRGGAAPAPVAGPVDDPEPERPRTTPGG
jgi:uncharacterized BrkB/YihY/UPF0761 family membrane protein